MSKNWQNQPRQTVISLGAGVQSTVLLLLSLRGELPRADHVVFSDTQWEPMSVYEHLAWLKEECDKEGLPLHEVTRGDLREAATLVRTAKESGNKYISKGIPLFILEEGKDRPGIGTRQCTEDFKIVPIDRFCRSLNAPIEMWMGITTDEAERMVDSRKKWKTLVYPFCRRQTGQYGAVGPERYAKVNRLLDKPWSRQDCLAWLAKHYPGRKIPRSACVICPYHSNAQWRYLRDNEPKEFARAVADEKLLQRQYGKATSIRGTPYLHRSCLPLDKAPIDEKDTKGLGMVNECRGMCGV